MIELIIFSIIAIVTSEILFFKHAKSDEWLGGKMLALIFGVVISLLLFGAPYSFAYGCNHDWIVEVMYESSEDCINYGVQAFFWYYGVIITTVLFFWINKKLLKKKEAKK